MPFFWEGLLGLSLVVSSAANPRPDIPHGYTLVKSTDVGKSTTYEEIGFFSSPTTPGASATFVPKYVRLMPLKATELMLISHYRMPRS